MVNHVTLLGYCARDTDLITTRGKLETTWGTHHLPACTAAEIAVLELLVHAAGS